MATTPQTSAERRKGSRRVHGDTVHLGQTVRMCLAVCAEPSANTRHTPAPTWRRGHLSPASRSPRGRGGGGGGERRAAACAAGPGGGHCRPRRLGRGLRQHWQLPRGQREVGPAPGGRMRTAAAGADAPPGRVIETTRAQPEGKRHAVAHPRDVSLGRGSGTARGAAEAGRARDGRPAARAGAGTGSSHARTMGEPILLEKLRYR